MSSSDISESLRAPATTAPPARMPSSIADPVPVGIAGFAMTTFVLSCINAGFFGGAASAPMVLGLAIFYGGLVQLVAGLWAFRRGETFVAVAFCSYGGGFWLSYFFLVYFIAPRLARSVGSGGPGSRGRITARARPRSAGAPRGGTARPHRRSCRGRK